MIETPSKDARLWATIAHLSSFVVLTGVLFFGSIVGPLAVYLIKKDEDPFIEMHAKEALNFHIALLVYAFLGAILWVGLFIGLVGWAATHPQSAMRHDVTGDGAEPPFWLVPILFPLAPVTVAVVAIVYVVVCMIVAAATASNGKPFRYPLTIRFIR